MIEVKAANKAKGSKANKAGVSRTNKAGVSKTNRARGSKVAKINGVNFSATQVAKGAGPREPSSQRK